ncbi:MAG: carboxymuconolactone decarboxylase family protein [Lentisphaeria bacterium]|nr:carboxymuconolactone decarboxylase family protein [Lentisphaeria bacterium]
MASVKFYDKGGDEKSLKIQQELKKHFGKVPNVFKAMGRSGDFLEAVLNLSEKAGKIIDPRTREMIMIAVSAVNGCTYCLDAHRTAALQLGITDEQISAVIEIAATISFFNAFNGAIDLESDLKSK